MIKVRITGAPKQVELLQQYLQKFGMTECTYVSLPYKQNRKSKYSKNVAVYMDFNDYNFEKQTNRRKHF